MLSSQEDGYLSDESDFYGSFPLLPLHLTINNLTTPGDYDTKAELEAQISAFDPLTYWETKRPTLNEIASHNLSTQEEKGKAKLYNPYAGLLCARQLSETVPEFLARLPPSTTLVMGNKYTPWIFIANPYRKIEKKDGGNQSQSQSHQSQVLDPGTEGPPAGVEDRDGFAVEGRSLLEELFQVQAGIEHKNKGKPKSTVTKLVNVARYKIVKSILDAAVKHKYTSGKVNYPVHHRDCGRLKVLM